MRRVVTTTDVRAWERAYDQGENIRSIALDFGRCPKTIAHHLAPSGRMPGKHTTATRIRRMADRGVETWLIAEELGISRNHVSAVRSLAKRKSKDAIKDHSQAQVAS